MTTDTPIIRAARALWEMSDQPFKLADTSPSMAIRESEPDLERFVPQVRAVLEAIREPTPDMVVAGDREFRNSIRFDKAALAWHAMIDAALALDTDPR